MKKTIRVSSYKRGSKLIKGYAYTRECGTPVKEGVGEEYRNTVFDKEAWDRLPSERQTTIKDTTIKQARVDRVVSYMQKGKVTPYGLLRKIWSDRKLAPTTKNVRKAVTWMKRNLPEYYSAISNNPSFNKQ